MQLTERTIRRILLSSSTTDTSIQWKKTPINPAFLEYYNRKVSEGKTKVQALICVMRRLVNILYGMMKNKTELLYSELFYPLKVKVFNLKKACLNAD